MSPLVLAVLLGIAALTVALTQSPSRAAHAYARRIDLALEPDVEASVARRLAARDRASGIGALVAVVAVGFWAWAAFDADDDRTGANVVVALAFFLGYAVGSASYGWYESTRPVQPGPRVARTTTPTHADYIDPLERGTLRVGAAVPAVLVLGLAILDAASTAIDLGPVPLWPAVVAVLAPVAAIAADALAARQLLARPQVAASTHELAWDDALRARTLRDSLTAALVVTLYAPLFYLSVVGARLEGGWPQNPAVGVVSAVAGFYVFAMVVLSLLALARRPQRHFRERLWGPARETAA